MKANKTQQALCALIKSQVNYWSNSHDITSPTHIGDIHEECFAQLVGLIPDDARMELEDILTQLYSFIRQFDDPNA